MANFHKDPMLLRGVKGHTTATTIAATAAATVFTIMDLKFHLLLEPHEIILKQSCTKKCRGHREKKIGIPDRLQKYALLDL
jgi:hypothetical protein